MQMPFIPYTILFCHVIESSSTADLAALGSFLETIEGPHFSMRHASAKNQLRFFQVLHGVAVKYVALKESSLGVTGQGLGGPSSGTGDHQARGPIDGYPSGQPAHGEVSASQDLLGSNFDPLGSLPGEDQFMTNLGLQVDSSGGMLASWFSSNQQLMRMLENA